MTWSLHLKVWFRTLRRVKFSQRSKFLSEAQKTYKKWAQWSDLSVPLDPLDLSTFWLLFVHFFFCTEGENDILTMFLSHFLHSPLSPQKSIFLSFWRKSLDDSWFLRRICDAHDVFNDCVTHAMMFLIQRVLWALMESIWRICNARGFKNCATRTVSDFMNPMRPSYLSCQTHFQCSMFLMLSTLSMTSVALDPLWVSGRHPHSLRLWAYEGFQVLLSLLLFICPANVSVTFDCASGTQRLAWNYTSFIS